MKNLFTVAFATTKSDKEGERTNESKHIYGNPYMPEACVHLALTLYIWLSALFVCGLVGYHFSVQCLV